NLSMRQPRRIKSERFMTTVKPLVWSEIGKPDRDNNYDHVTAETPFGQIKIAWKSWKDIENGGRGSETRDILESPWGYMDGAYDLNTAKAMAQAEFEKRILACLE
ncbi:MAG TPA: hypothetical protein VNT76_24250, partial [Candidatus Binatus sp.]|nr:hypothetical protein [Candidatus Binatus sp.]